MTDRPLVMLSLPSLKRTAPSLEAAGMATAAGWEMTDDQRAQVRGVIHFGSQPLAPELLDSLPNLGLVACVSVGYDGLDVPGLRARGIEVTHCQGLNAGDVADHAMGLILGGWRDIVSGDRLVRAGGWGPGQRLVLRRSLAGLQLGVVGLGAIGQAVARRAEAFGMRVAWWGPNPKEVPWPRAENLMALAQASDILVVATLANASNVGMISRAVIEAVGPEGMIVNVARGKLIDEDALVAALRDGRLGMAGLDVFVEEPTPAARWADLENVVVTPHSGGGTHESIQRQFDQAVENLRRFFAGEPLLSPVAA